MFLFHCLSYTEFLHPWCSCQTWNIQNVLLPLFHCLSYTECLYPIPLIPELRATTALLKSSTTVDAWSAKACCKACRLLGERAGRPFLPLKFRPSSSCSLNILLATFSKKFPSEQDFDVAQYLWFNEEMKIPSRNVFEARNVRGDSMEFTWTREFFSLS